MIYKMECPRCGKDMKYIKIEKYEILGWIAMECPNGCDDGYLVPKENPMLEKIQTE